MSDINPNNPYAAPASALQETPRDSQVPSIEEALSRGYDFNISDLLSEACQRVKGTKGIIIGGFLVFYAVLLAASFLIGGFFGLLGVAGDSTMLAVVAELVIGILASALAYPFMAPEFIE
ncbi:hypothetical protein [Pseudomonas sp.]|uniref:hypothetical protein n=1 Tax=Pseudomonas sp. TaxID=306 RepID=UPI004053FB4D